MTLPLDPCEIGPEQWHKAVEGQFRYRGSRLSARMDAAHFGTLAAEKLIALRDYPLTPEGQRHAADDAVTLARISFRGWRAMRYMDAMDQALAKREER